MSLLSILVLVGGLLAMLAYFQFRSTSYLRSQDLDRRLEAYAKMKDPCHKPSKTTMLSKEQHDILLGILKKVEAKNSALFRAWTFIAAGDLALISSSLCDEIDEYLVVLLVLVLPFVWASLRGMRQVDQLDMPSETTVERLVELMQVELKNDLLVKEASFDFAYKGAFVLITTSIGAFAIYLLAEKCG